MYLTNFDSIGGIMYVALIIPTDIDANSAPGSITVLGPFENESQAKTYAMAAYTDNETLGNGVRWDVSEVITSEQYANRLGV